MFQKIVHDNNSLLSLIEMTVKQIYAERQMHIVHAFLAHEIRISVFSYPCEIILILSHISVPAHRKDKQEDPRALDRSPDSWHMRR